MKSSFVFLSEFKVYKFLSSIFFGTNSYCFKNMYKTENELAEDCNEIKKKDPKMYEVSPALQELLSLSFLIS